MLLCDRGNGDERNSPVGRGSDDGSREAAKRAIIEHYLSCRICKTSEDRIEGCETFTNLTVELAKELMK